jgi:2-polyprenyl-3-methyl-5-hydroxy-6-metoxy-1,4-benzoquinol methylase
MNTRELISTTKYLASARPSFLLSELSTYLTGEFTVGELYHVLAPHLARLNLTATKTDGDFEISKILPAQPYILNQKERERLDEFFTQHTLPAALEGGIERYVTKKVGKEWDDPVILERLRHAIVAQKDDYWKPAGQRSLQYTKGYSVLGYLVYHFPVYFMQTGHLLAMLARDGLLKKSMTILDVGTGPGVVPLAIAGFYSHLDNAQAAVWSVERSEEHIGAFSFLTGVFAKDIRNVEIKTPVKTDIRSPDRSALPEKFDLIVFSNVLNELPDATMESRAEIVAHFSERLAPDGSVLIIEPADEENATRMRTLTVALTKKGLSVHSPCSFIWGTPCTAPRCWSFETAPSINPTRMMETLAGGKEPYRYVNTDIKYSYAVLRKDALRRKSHRLITKSKFLRMSKLFLHTGKRVNVAGSMMSGELGDARTHVYKICDGTAKTPVYAVLPSYHITPGNDAITSAPYGSIVELRGVLVRYNKAHDAYNLLVSRNTRVQQPD